MHTTAKLPTTLCDLGGLASPHARRVLTVLRLRLVIPRTLCDVQTPRTHSGTLLDTRKPETSRCASGDTCPPRHDKAEEPGVLAGRRRRQGAAQT